MSSSSLSSPISSWSSRSRHYNSHKPHAVFESHIFESDVQWFSPSHLPHEPLEQTVISSPPRARATCHMPTCDELVEVCLVGPYKASFVRCFHISWLVGHKSWKIMTCFFPLFILQVKQIFPILKTRLGTSWRDSVAIILPRNQSELRPVSFYFFLQVDASIWVMKMWAERLLGEALKFWRNPQERIILTTTAFRVNEVFKIRYIDRKGCWEKEYLSPEKLPRETDGRQHTSLRQHFSDQFASSSECRSLFQLSSLSSISLEIDTWKTPEIATLFHNQGEFSKIRRKDEVPLRN